jgi:photosystem II stability/assembly factor-like uncharacterized protein
MKNRKNPVNRQRIPSALLLFTGILLCVLLLPQDMAAQWRLLLPRATFSITMNPQNHRTLYVGGEGRNVYRSYDGGATWDTLNIIFNEGSGWVSNIFIHPADTTILLAGGQQIGGVNRSTDNGQTWTKVIDRLPEVSLNGEVIVAKPDNTDTLYVGNLLPGTIYRSINKGMTWDSISVIEDIPFLCTLTIREDSTNIIFAGCSDGVIRKSTDGGLTWRKTIVHHNTNEPFTNNIEIPKIVFSKINPAVGYAAATVFFPPALPNAGLYRTTDWGETWEHFQFRDTSIWAVDVRERFGADELFAGGFSGFATELPGRGVVRHSVDNGALWLKMDDNIDWVEGENFRADIWMIKYLGPRENPRLYLASEAGLFIYDIALSVSNPVVSKHRYLTVADDVVTVTPDETIPGILSLRCSDALGRTVATYDVESSGSRQFRLPDLSRGVYFVQLFRNGVPVDVLSYSSSR